MKGKGGEETANVKDLSMEELEQLIEQKSLEILGDPDAGLELNGYWPSKGDLQGAMTGGGIFDLKRTPVAKRVVKVLVKWSEG